MAENMNIGTKINSTTGGYQQTNNGIIEKYCYNNDPAECEIYGGLYEWPEAMQYVITESSQGICPIGWHLPADNEWKMLEGTVDSQYPVGDPVWNNNGWRGSDAGGNLKETGTIHWNNPNTGATNESGFTALPGGHRYFDDGMFYNRNYFGDFWTSSESNTSNAWFRELWYGESRINRPDGRKENGLSVRCLKDNL
jgi:uncharacterized protein (TIGR02145 family)